MRLKKLVRFVAVTLLFASTTIAFPLCTLASEVIPSVSIPESATNNITPPASEISEDPQYAEGFSSNLLTPGGPMLASSTTVSGGCSITKVSSTSVTISGYSTCSASNPALSVSLSLQAYYSGSWHTLATKVRTVSGTYVSTSQGYTVTSGYYYRTYAMHWLSDGTLTTSRTGSIWVG